MSHTNQTPNYHLPQFIGTDKPAWLVDFNQAMSDIDTQMKANETASGTAEADAQSALSGVTALNSQVGGIQTSVTALETQAPLDEAQIETNRQNIATNAQNIVDLDNRMGHTSISGIGDGSATGAIKAVDDKVGDLADLDTTDKTSIVNAINEAVAGGGGDASTVRYNNGWIEYTDDGGTTWHQLINVATPQQLLPVMTGNTSAVGNASKTGTVTGDAYKSIDGSSGDIAGCCRFPNDADSVVFTFANPTYVKYANVNYIQDSDSQSQLRLDYSEDGVTWMAGGVISVPYPDSTERTLTQTINATVKALRIFKVGGSGAFRAGKLEAYN